MDQRAFLQVVRTALGVRAGRDIAPDEATRFFDEAPFVESNAQSARDRANADAAGLLDEMAAAAGEAGWAVHRSESPEGAAEAVAGICRDAGARNALRSEHAVFERVPVDAVLRGEGIEIAAAVREATEDAEEDLERRLELRSRSFEADVGITGVDYAVAETGTVVVEPRNGVSRLVSLTPPVHIAILEAGDVLPSLDELFLLARDDFLSGAHRGMMNLITGPSRTADIEGDLVLGVHGPVEVHLVIVG